MTRDKVADLLPAQWRARIYTALSAVSAVALVWGFDGVAAKVAATLQVLGFGVARIMTPTKSFGEQLRYDIKVEHPSGDEWLKG